MRSKRSGYGYEEKSFGLRAGTDIVTDLCQHKILLLCGRERAQCASIELGCSHVVLKLNNGLLKIKSIIESIDASMIITYLNPRLGKSFFT